MRSAEQPATGAGEAAGDGPSQAAGEGPSRAAGEGPSRARRAVAIIAVLLGVPVGAVWARLAPGEQFKIFGNGSYLPLPTADYHPFDGIALFVLATAALGLIIAVAAWRIRAIRGVATLLAVAGSTAIGAGLALVVATALAGGSGPGDAGATGTDFIMVAGPRLDTPLVVIVEPLVAVIVYTFLAAWDGRADLGRQRAAAPQPVAAQPAQPVGAQSPEAADAPDPAAHPTDL